VGVIWESKGLFVSSYIDLDGSLVLVAKMTIEATAGGRLPSTNIE
jgi:hypothetical protein